MTLAVVLLFDDCFKFNVRQNEYCIIIILFNMCTDTDIKLFVKLTVFLCFCYRRIRSTCCEEHVRTFINFNIYVYYNIYLIYINILISDRTIILIYNLNFHLLRTYNVQ
jgi:hypothetical protein